MNYMICTHYKDKKYNLLLYWIILLFLKREKYVFYVNNLQKNALIHHTNKDV